MIEEAIKKIVGAVETVAPKAWELLVQGQRINGYVMLGKQITGITALTVICLVAWFKIRPVLESDMSERDRGAPTAIVSLLIGIASIIALFVVVGIPDSIGRILAPDSFAAQDLIQRATKE